MQLKEWDGWVSSPSDRVMSPTSCSWIGTNSTYPSPIGPLWWQPCLLSQAFKHQQTLPTSARMLCKPQTTPFTSKLDITYSTLFQCWWTLFVSAFTGSCLETSSRKSIAIMISLDGADQFTWSWFTLYQPPPPSSMLFAPTQYWERRIGNSLHIWPFYMEAYSGYFS